MTRFNLVVLLTFVFALGCNGEEFTAFGTTATPDATGPEMDGSAGGAPGTGGASHGTGGAVAVGTGGAFHGTGGTVAVDAGGEPETDANAPASGGRGSGTGGTGGSPSSGGASSGGSLGTGGVVGTGGAPGCTMGDVRCSGSQPQTCVNGVWLANGAICSGALPVCLDGACVECSPGAKSCASPSQPSTCNSTGAWATGAACSSSTQECFEGTCVHICCGASICELGSGSYCAASSAGAPSCLNGCYLGHTCSFGIVKACDPQP